MIDENLPNSSIKIAYEGSSFLLFREDERLWEFDSSEGPTFDNLYSRVCNIVSGHPRDRFPLSNYRLELTDDARAHLKEDQITKLKRRIEVIGEKEEESEYKAHKAQKGVSESEVSEE